MQPIREKAIQVKEEWRGLVHRRTPQRILKQSIEYNLIGSKKSVEIPRKIW